MTLAKNQILVVEDESVVAMDIQDRLESLGYGVVATVATGKRAIEKAGSLRPDLVLMDIQLQGEMDGVQAADEIRRCYHIPVVYLTANADHPTLERAKLTDPFGYIIKPFEERELHTAVEMALYKHRTEQKLKESEQWLSATLRGIGDGVIATDKFGAVTFINPVAECLTGWSQEAALGRELREVFSIIDEKTRKTIESPVTRALKEDVTSRLASHTLLVAKDGAEKPIEDSASPIADKQGNVIGVVTVFRDLSEKKQAEEALRESEEQLRQSQKMEAVGQLAGGVAHDFNNLLAVIIGYSDMLLRRSSSALSEDAQRKVEQINEAAHRAAGLTRQLLAFSRKQVLQPKLMDLNTVVGNMDKMLKRVIGEHIEMLTILDPKLGIVKADPGQIEQVLLNLAVNARDAMPAGGKVTIETGTVVLDGQYIQTHQAVEPGPYVMLAVSDTGVGMSAEVRSRIFEPFFTTKDKDKGTGLGLSTVYGIVQQSGGSIWVYSELGQGTTFKVYLPCVDQDADIDEALPATADYRGSETVLLVEDEDVVRQVAYEMLTMNGYSVLQTSNGNEALEVSRQHEGVIDLMVTDVVMPSMGGPELARRLAVTRPEMRVLYMSGYTDDAVFNHGVLQEGTAFLQKPFTSASLGCKLREVISLSPAT
jgi:PAS domain S-box-containing protein